VEVGIIGLPKSGKTTIFNALTKGKTAISAHHTATLAPHIGIAKVPDTRLTLIENTFHPKKTIPAEIKYVDIAGAPKEFGKGDTVGGQFLTHLMSADTLLQVVRVFEDDEVPHIEGSIDPKRDITIFDLELTMSDLTIIGRRLQKLDEALKGAKSPERELHLKEKALIEKLKSGLEKEIPIRQQGLSETELKSLANYQFLTAKPMLILLNLGENQLSQVDSLEREIRSFYSHPQSEIVAACGKLEMELAELSDAEAKEFRHDLGLEESTLNRLVSLSYKLLGLISFFTTASAELKAWTITNGTTALKAAGKIHSDMERGFIRAEVISFRDLERMGNLAEARKHGLLRTEGKNYIVQDGDIITFLFHTA